MGNLTVAKGLGAAITFAHEAIQSGLAGQLILAGPLEGVEERRLIDSNTSDGRIQYRGPVYGVDKERFFRDIDVFLLPSRYRNELSPLVLWEARLRGIPVITYRTGCVNEVMLEGGGVLVELNGDLTTLASAQLRRWSSDVASLAEAQAQCRNAAQRQRDQALAAGRVAARRLFDA
jgi:glycosyltransferase involved in cell wall biosynthesis